MESISNGELLELFFTGQDLMDAQFQYWISASVAAIVASFVAGTRMSRKMGYVLAFLYLAATALFAMKYFAAVGTISEIAAEAVTRGLLGSIGRELSQPLLIVRSVLFVTGTIATIWFLLTKKLRNEEHKTLETPRDA